MYFVERSFLYFHINFSDVFCKLQICQIGLGNGSLLKRQPDITQTIDDPDHCCKYKSPSPNKAHNLSEIWYNYVTRNLHSVQITGYRWHECSHICHVPCTQNNHKNCHQKINQSQLLYHMFFKKKLSSKDNTVSITLTHVSLKKNP